MTKSYLLRATILGLSLVTTTCARAEQPTLATALIADEALTQSSEQTVQSFTTVEGATLAARLDAASQKARGGQTPYWSAYAFDVRPGVAVDPDVREFHGSMDTIGDTSVFVGTTASGVRVETRNLAVFILREPGNNQISRMEIYNLERKREYSGYPVYWLGRANNEESLNYLRGLSDATTTTMLTERAVLGISLHDDPRVGGMLKTFIRPSQNTRIRTSAIYWLGQVGGEATFLADIVRNESEDKKIRRQAAHAIGAGRERGTVAVLQSLYDSIKDTELRRAIVGAAGNNQEQDQAYAFVLKVARTDPERDVRRAAVHQMGNLERPNAPEDLMKIYTTETDLEVRKSVFHALSDTKLPAAQAQILNLARTEPNLELRKRAIRVLAERGDASVNDLLNLYDAERAPDVRRAILQTLGELKSPKVEDKLFEVARQDESLDLRRVAIRLLGERAGKRSLDFLSATAQSADGETEVQIQAVRAISERRAEESVPLLIKIAKTHGNQLVRKQAIRALGESGDPRAVEYFREVLAK